MNIGLLLCVAFLPVASSAVTRYPAERPTVVFYALCLAVTGLAQLVVWHAATTRHWLVGDYVQPGHIRYIRLRAIIPMLVSLLAAAIALVSPVAALALLAALFVVAIPLGQIYFRVLARIAGADL
jgi:uncharacterized membrane protein